MIKEKLTPELINRFKEEIQKTIRDGKEHGFSICTDDILYATKSCIGEKCSLEGYEKLRYQCLPNKTLGNFHTHPSIAIGREILEKRLGRKVSTGDVKKAIIDTARKRNITLTSPSHGDLLDALALRYSKKELGVACVGTDIDPNKVECWISKKGIETKDDVIKLGEELQSSAVNDPPHEWVKPFFNREIIDLR